MLRVLYVGNFEPDHSTENDVRRAFEHLGWEVGRVQERDFAAAASFEGADAWQHYVHSALDSDLVLHTMTQGSYPNPERVLGLWDLLRERDVPTASIHLDLFYGLASPKDSGPQRCDLPRLHPMFRVDHVFTADGDHEAEFARDGVNHHWLPPAVRYDEARDIPPGPGELDRFSRFRVGFCGARGYHPEHDRASLVDALAERYGDLFVRVAGDTPYGTVRGEALNRMYATIPVWVGDSCFAGTAERYWSDRWPETFGRGGFLVSPYINGLACEVGPRYPAWGPYKDRTAMFESIDWWLAHPDEREERRKVYAGIVRREHTYVNRVETMLATIFPERETGGHRKPGNTASDRGRGPAGASAQVALDRYSAVLLEAADECDAMAARLRAIAEVPG